MTRRPRVWLVLLLGLLALWLWDLQRRLPTLAQRLRRTNALDHVAVPTNAIPQLRDQFPDWRTNPP